MFRSKYALGATLSIALLGSSTGCTSPVQRSQSYVDVAIDADKIVRTATVRVEVDIEVQSQAGAGWQNKEPRTFRPDPDEITWPIEFKLTLEPKAVVPSFSLVATAFDRQGAIVARAQTIREPKRALDKGLRVHFEAACFRQSEVCSDGETCSDGACVNARNDKPIEPAETSTGMATSANTVAPAAASDPDEGLAKEGGPCSGDARACPQHAATNPLKCEGGVWRADAPCSPEERCDTGSGDRRGTCQAIARECTNQKPDVAFCDGDKMLVCTDLVSSKVRPCAENHRCVPGKTEAECACSPGYVSDGSTCRKSNDCDLDNGGCDKVTTCSVNGSGRVCGECPAGYRGTGEAGCAPLLQRLDAGDATITPAVAPDVVSYRVHASLLMPVLQLMAAGPGATHVAFDGVEVEQGQAWSSDRLLRGETKLGLTLTSESGVASKYELTIDRTADQQAFLKASNPGLSDWLGMSLAISGDTLAAGAHREDSAATGINGDQSSNAASDSGAVYVYRRNGGKWTQEAFIKSMNSQALDRFGTDVALDGDTLVVGASRNNEVGEAALQSLREPGAAYVFTRTNGTWAEVQELTPSRSNAGDRFGGAIALEGDRLAIGAANPASGGGTTNVVYVFERSGGKWVERQILTPSRPDTVSFGQVALSGDTLVIGSAGSGGTGNGATVSKGAAVVFARKNGQWAEQQDLTPDMLEDNATFGYRVAVRGDRIAVTAPHLPKDAWFPDAPASRTAPGEAYVFELEGGVWKQTGHVRSPVPVDADYFGSGLALSSTTLLIGANNEDGSSKGLDGDPARRGTITSGAIFQFAKVGAEWVYTDYLKADNAATNHGLGFRLAVSGETLAVTAPTEDTAATSSGAVYVFE